ncbi:unnamed protein product [Phaedon cochleariae]|uniref:Nucleolar protein 11 n=1 Tax=Phaedon cochleariae TaxID=80249 RepID=A0A9P0DW35_PHACE|nr:unnamed protein product [Phaedon cochleariae]
MAKLGAFYALCPLIDNKYILGVTEDLEKGFVIATLGKNIASRYKISDQKQVSCWRTKEKFSSAVIYDKALGKYGAVFNKSFIKMWESEESLDKLKKYKFNTPIHTIISKNGHSFLVFQNGAVMKLAEALDQRKSLNPKGLDIKEIDDIIYGEMHEDFYFGIIVKTGGNTLYWTRYAEGHTTKFNKIQLDRDLSLIGYAFHPVKNNMNVLILWSDGSIYSYNLQDSYMETPCIGELFTVIDSLSTKHSVSILSLDENYIAMYGANYNEEGAVLVIYNTQFKVTQSKQPFKLFTNNSEIWRVEENLMVPVGQNLAVIPFHLENEQLAALVGSHKIVQDKDSEVRIVQEVDVASWDTKYKMRDRQLPEDLKNQISELITCGLPESIILEETLPEIFKTHDTASLYLCIRHFSDIPEEYLAKILKYTLDLDANYFNEKKSEFVNLPEILQPLERVKILDNIFSRPFSEVLLLPFLRQQLSIGDVSLLLNYICLLWSDDQSTLPHLNSIETESKLLHWSCILIDSNYQKIILSNDKSIRECLGVLNRLIQDHLSCLGDLKVILPMLRNIKKTSQCTDANMLSLRYSVEQLSLY